jgi:molecular chaperone GrpE
MSEENIHHPDPEHQEGDPVEEMIGEGAPPPDLEAPQTDEIDRELEIFQDMQRLQADFVNYKTRVDRDRGLERQLAVADTLKAFIPVFDDLHRAQQYGDLAEGTPMAAIAQKLNGVGEKLGLVTFGQKGDKFDPELHDALVQTPSPDVTEATVADVVEQGYRIGDRLLRPAKVAVFVPAE